ncbi:MAG TPA: glycosyltransferase family 87 protein [Gemmatimonadales bacterium]|nr:glycosyltransferase family 87 protein [Gemmatimonadales bacterium]
MTAAPDAPSRSPSRGGWWTEGRWQSAVLILIALIGFVSWGPRLGDFAGYLMVGNAVLDGKHIYHDTPPGINTWPPFFALVCVPLALIGRVSTYLATSSWLVLSYAVLLLVLDLLARILYGQPMTLRRTGPGIPIASAGLFVPLLLTSTYLFNNFEHTQISVVLLGLTVGGLYLIDRGRTWAGSAALGLAIAMKLMPVVFLPYFALRRQWRAFFQCGLITGALSLSPILVFGWTRYWDYVASWRKVLGWGWGVGAYNQSLYALWDRFIGHHVYPFAPGDNYNLNRSGDPAVQAAFLVSLAILGLLTLWRLLKPPFDRPRTAITEWSAVLILSTMWGPVLWKLYLVVLLVPAALLFAVWRSPGLDAASRRTCAWFLFGSAVLQLGTAHDIAGRWLSPQLELGGVATWSALVMLAGVLWLRGRPDLLGGTH